MVRNIVSSRESVVSIYALVGKTLTFLSINKIEILALQTHFQRKRQRTVTIIKTSKRQLQLKYFKHVSITLRHVPMHLP